MELLHLLENLEIKSLQQLSNIQLLVVLLLEIPDEGEVLRERVHDLKQLVAAYQLGWITETRCEDHIW